MRAVNLLPRDDAQRSQKPQNLPALLSTAAIVLVTGLLGVLYFTAKSTAETKSLELADAKAELALLPTPAESEAKTAPQRQLATEHGARISALSSAFGYRVAWDRVLREISLVLPEDVWLVELQGTSPTAPGTQPVPATPNGMAPTALLVNGYTYSHDGVARFMTRLSVIPDLRNVWLERSQRILVGGRPVISFVIKADVRGGGAAS